MGVCPFLLSNLREIRFRISQNGGRHYIRGASISSNPLLLAERCVLPKTEDYEEDPNLAIEIPQTPENLANDIMPGSRCA